MTQDIKHLKDLTPDPRNARKHNPRNVGMIETALQTVGAARSIVVDENGVVLAGNATIEAAAAVGIERVQVVDADGETIIAVRRKGLTPEQKTKLALFDNRTAELAEWDVSEVLATLEAGVNLDALWRPDELEALVAAASVPTAAGEDKGAQVDRAAELQAQWGTALGQVWELGEHRLAVGDCTDRAVVEAVMRGEKAHMVWTDPPYGVAVGDKNKFLNSIARSNRVEKNLVNDTLDEAGLAALLAAAFDNAMAVSPAGAAWYVAAPAVPLHLLFGQALKDRGIWRQIIHWVKNNATFAPLGVDYHWQEEPIFYGWVPGAAHRFFGGRTQTTVWEIDRPTKSPEHPTMKPVELVERAINNSSLPGEVVFDPFCGSGTTLVACEKLRRKCRAIEIDEGYAAVILQRLADMGLEPRLLT